MSQRILCCGSKLPSWEYRRIIISRPNAQFDDDIGFLPGDEQEKIAPLMRPVIDNLEQLLDSDEENRYENEMLLTDRPFLDERTNGLSYAAKHMKGSPLCWQITLSAEECERSALAMDAVKRL